jgi:hypothetical protein
VPARRAAGPESESKARSISITGSSVEPHIRARARTLVVASVAGLQRHHSEQNQGRASLEGRPPLQQAAWRLLGISLSRGQRKVVDTSVACDSECWRAGNARVRAHVGWAAHAQACCGATLPRAQALLNICSVPRKQSHMSCVRPSGLGRVACPQGSGSHQVTSARPPLSARRLEAHVNHPKEMCNLGLSGGLS